jgi:hypothetical protein
MHTKRSTIVYVRFNIVLPAPPKKKKRYLYINPRHLRQQRVFADVIKLRVCDGP